MPNKKIWAYAIDETGEYVAGKKHPLKIYYIWEALKLKRKAIHEFNKLIFMSTHRVIEKRMPMSVVKLGFFRFKKAPEEKNNMDGDSDSLSHSIAIQALAEQTTLNFVCGVIKFSIEVDDIRTEDTKIQLTNRDKFEYYYPDLICQFKSPEGLAQKWGNKLAIEVKHTHACEDEKVFDFKNHCIPIIEIDIAKYSIENKYKTKSPSPEQLEDYYNYWKALFAEKIFGRILSDPVTSDYHEVFTNEANDTLSKMREQNIELKNKLAELHNHNSILKNRIHNETRHVEKLEKSLQVKSQKIEELENRGLSDFLIQAIGFKG